MKSRHKINLKVIKSKKKSRKIKSRKPKSRKIKSRKIKSRKPRNSKFSVADPILQNERIYRKRQIRDKIINLNIQITEIKNHSTNVDHKINELIPQTINQLHEQTFHIKKTVRDLTTTQLDFLNRHRVIGKNESDTVVNQIYKFEGFVNSIFYDLENKLINDMTMLLNNIHKKMLVESDKFITQEINKVENEISNLENEIQTAENLAITQEQELIKNVAYQTPPPTIDILRRIDNVTKEEVRATHVLRASGEFTFDYDNMCNNVGLKNALGHIELYSELQHFINTGQITGDNAGITALESYGIFSDFNNIPNLKLIEHIDNDRDVYKYGRHKLTLLLPANPNDLINIADPHRIFGQGTFGVIYKGLINAEPISIKRLRNVSLEDLAIETVIQTHLYCLLNTLNLSTPFIAKIPKIINIGKHKDNQTGEQKYLIGMETLDGNLSQYLDVNWGNGFKNMLFSIRNLLNNLVATEGFMHRDLHCGNIMFKNVAGDHEFYLIDFGMSVLIKRNILNNGTNYNEQTTINPSHDMRMLLSSIINNKTVTEWDTTEMRVYARNIAKRFSYCVMNYYKNVSQNPIFYQMYSQVVDENDWRFDVLQNEHFVEDFVDIPSETPTPTVAEIAAIPVDNNNKLLRFVKRYYTY